MIFVDTGAWLALFDKNDQYHPQAKLVWKRLVSEQTRLITSNIVIVDTLTLLARRIRYSYAVEMGHRLYSSSHLTVIRPDGDDEFQALMLMAKWADQKVGFADCLSFQLLRRRQILSVFAFDRHFELAGFTLLQVGEKEDKPSL